MKQVSLRLNWTPQTEHAGFYVALWKGYYEETGLKVEIHAATKDKQSVPQVSQGLDHFGLADPHNLILSRAVDMPIKTISQLQHDSYLRYIAKKNQSIKKLEDLRGKKVSLWFGGGEIEFFAMLDSVGLKPSDLQIVEQQGDDMSHFFNDLVDVSSVTLSNELQIVFENGYREEDLIIFKGRDFGTELVGKGIITSEKMLEKYPDCVLSFVSASIRGWLYAYNNPEETAKLFNQFFPHLDYKKMLLMMEVFNQLNSVGKAKNFGIGYIDLNLFEKAKESMNRIGLLEKDIDVNDCVSTIFWEATKSEYKTISE